MNIVLQYLAVVLGLSLATACSQTLRVVQADPRPSALSAPPPSKISERQAPSSPGTASASRTPIETEEIRTVTFAAVGDVLPHTAVKESARAANSTSKGGQSINNEGFDALFAATANTLSQADLAIANLETPVSPSGDPGGIPFHFNAPTSLLFALKQAGIDVVSFANNHVYDQQRKGLLETLKELEKVGILYAGAGRTLDKAKHGIRLQKNGINIAILGASQFFNNKNGETQKNNIPQANKLDTATMKKSIHNARQEADLVIVCIHWGQEYEIRPRHQETKLAHQLLEAGADIILGTHPHVLQPLERYTTKDGRRGLIAYSLGNFVSNQSRFYKFGISAESEGDTRDGVVLKFSAIQHRHADKKTTVEIGEVTFSSLWTDNQRIYQADSPKAIPYIRVIEIDSALEDARFELNNLLFFHNNNFYTALYTARSWPWPDPEVIRLKKRIQLLERRKAIIQKRLAFSTSGAFGALVRSNPHAHTFGQAR